jgi:hypothetical protein
MYHDRTAWRCAFFVGKKYGSKGYPHTGNAAHMGSISCPLVATWICNLLIESPTYFPTIYLLPITSLSAPVGHNTFKLYFL